ncbi:MAG: rhamnan synthesis F family protein [Verrucomicrobiota bacterium]|nr:rhamnan synthesis F family protein [Verrucomicrobiota bacterium]
MKLLVALHIYYLDQAAYFAKQFDHLKGLDCDFLITTNKDSDMLRAEFARFNPTFFMVPNRGLDIGPFFYAMEHVDLDPYDLIIKLHAKRIQRRAYSKNYNGYYTAGKWQRNLLVESLIGSPEIIKNNLAEFAKHSDSNMLGSPYSITPVENQYKEMAKKYALQANPSDAYIAGTMFMVRTQVIKNLMQIIHFDDFQEVTAFNRHDVEFPFFMERFFGLFAGGEMRPGARDEKFEKLSKWFGIRRIFWQNFQTNHGRHMIRILGIPIYWRHIAKT